MVHQLENIDSHLKGDTYYYNIGGITFLRDHKQLNDAHKLQSDCTCMTHGIPKVKAATHTASTNSSLNLKICISICWNSSSRLVTNTSTIANYKQRKKTKIKQDARLLQLLLHPQNLPLKSTNGNLYFQFTSLSSPRHSSMRKKSTAQSWGNGMLAKACG